MANPPNAIPAIPKETARATNAIYGRSNFYILIGGHLETILENLQFQYASERGGVSETEGPICALITFFQYIEGLTDTQAVDAVRTRTEWKFALHLPLVPAIFREAALCGFRQRMLADRVCQAQFQRLIDRIVLFTPPLNNMQNLKSLDLISLVCSANRLDRAQQAMERVLEALAARSPAWLRTITLPHWYGRYNEASAGYDRAALPGSYRVFMEEIGADIRHLLEEIQSSGSPELSEMPEVRALAQIWAQLFHSLNLEPNHRPVTVDLNNCDTCILK